MTEHTFDFIDLFAGIGGFHHGLAHPDFGGRCVMSCEIDADARAVYRASFPELPADRLVADIRTITRNVDGTDRSADEIAQLVPDHDVLCAGFPCQPFSKSGHQLGVRDQVRGTLFFDIMEIVRAKRPRFLILENVRNLAGPRHRDTWNTIVWSLREAGYRVADAPVVLSPHMLADGLGGAPQIRDRVFILAERVDDAPGGFGMPPLAAYEPAPTGWSPDRWDIEEYLDPDAAIPATSSVWLRPDEEAWLEAWNEFVKRIEAPNLPGFPIWVDAFTKDPLIAPSTPAWKRTFLEKNAAFYAQHSGTIDVWLKEQWGPTRQTVREFPASRRKFEWQARKAQGDGADRDIWKLVIQLRPSGIRVKPPTYLPALVAITQTSIIGSRRRRITPREAARLQGIPSEGFERAGVEDSVAYKQLGNAVNVGVVRHLARKLFASAGLDWGRGRAGLLEMVVAS